MYFCAVSVSSTDYATDGTIQAMQQTKSLGKFPEGIFHTIHADDTFTLGDIAVHPMMVTPIGICLSYYVQSNNFIFVEFNGERVKLYDNGKLSVTDAAMQFQLCSRVPCRWG